MSNKEQGDEFMMKYDILLRTISVMKLHMRSETSRVEKKMPLLFVQHQAITEQKGLIVNWTEK